MNLPVTPTNWQAAGREAAEQASDLTRTIWRQYWDKISSPEHLANLYGIPEAQVCGILAGDPFNPYEEVHGDQYGVFVPLAS
jgi:hypothetical protein